MSFINIQNELLNLTFNEIIIINIVKKTLLIKIPIKLDLIEKKL